MEKIFSQSLTNPEAEPPGLRSGCTPHRPASNELTVRFNQECGDRMKNIMVVRKGAIVLMISGAMAAAGAQHVRVGVDGGFARFTDETSSGWNTGYSVGGHVFFLPMPMVQVGLRLAYDRWSPKNGIIVNGLPGGAVDLTSSGNFSNTEIVPTLRLASAMSGSPLNFFGQAGAGLYLYNSNVTVSGTSNRNSFSVSATTTENGNFGVNLGGGLSVGKQSFLAIELFPLYHWIFHGSRTVQYFTTSLAVVFGM